MILGAGAGGFGACSKLAEHNISTVIVDKNPGFGGTAVYSGVSCFEPGVSLDGIHRTLADKLMKNGGGEVQKSIPSRFTFSKDRTCADDSEPLVSPGYRWGLSAACGDRYEDTLKRCKSLCSSTRDLKRFMTDENALGAAMHEVISKHSQWVTPLFNHNYVRCKTQGRSIVSVTVSNGSEETEIFAKYFIDASGSIVLLRDAGCPYEIGQNADLSKVNGMTVVFRVTKEACPDIEVTCKEDISQWKEERLANVVSCFNMYPNGDININMLPTLTGKEYFDFGEKAYDVGICRVLAYWEHLQNLHAELKDYRIKKIFLPGIREDYRLVGKKVLTSDDIIHGINKAEKPIAIADHALDSHGSDGQLSGEVQEPYGIPIECTMPSEYDNAFAACRGASFSSVVASSARLTRTMMSMGEGVAKYIIAALQ